MLPARKQVQFLRSVNLNCWVQNLIARIRVLRQTFLN